MILHEIRNTLILKSPWIDLVAVPRPASLPAEDAALSELSFTLQSVPVPTSPYLASARVMVRVELPAIPM